MTAPSATNLLRQLERVSQVGIAAIEEQMAERTPWLRRRPVDPVTVLTEDVLQTSAEGRS